MNVLEKAEKSLEYLKNLQISAKSHELQTATGTLGRCLGALGCRPNYARHYANLLHSAVPTLLALASNDSAEIRLVGDEALNRAVVGGYPFHAYKTNIILQNQIDHTKNARWIRAALSRICLGDCWVRPGVGKIRSQAQTLFPKLSQIVRQTSDIQLIVEALDTNLPRILNALAEYTSDEELLELARTLFYHVDSHEPAVRRSVAACLARLCAHKESLLTHILAKVFDKLWPHSSESNVVLGWFGVVKATFQINEMSHFIEDDRFTVQEYLELYQLCIHYLERSTIEHNIQNGVMECLSVLLSHPTGDYARALLEKNHRPISLDHRQNRRTHIRNISSVSAITSVISNMTSSMMEDMTTGDTSELTFTGALHLGSLSQLQTPMLSVEDLTIQTPDSPESDIEVDVPSTELSKRLTEKLEEIEDRDLKDDELPTEATQPETIVKTNIGSSLDEDIPLKYCARLLTSKFLLTGNKNCLIPDRNVRVSVKASALTCLSEVLRHYPQAATMYLDKDVDNKCHNVSGSSEGTDSNQDNINDFILERNVCYQDSLTDSLVQDLLNKSLESQTSQSQQASKKDSRSESVDQKSSKDVPSNILDSKHTKNDLMTSADSTNPNMTNSNFTMNSNMTASNDPLSTGYPMTSSADVLSSSIDLDMKFDHFGESTTNLDNLDALKDLDEHRREKRGLKRTDEVTNVAPNDEVLESKNSESDYRNLKSDEAFEYQHMSDVFVLLEAHCDPQIRGLVRLCMGNYLSAALDLSHGNYYKWRNFNTLPKDVNINITTDKLVDLILKGLSDDIHSCVNHTLTALTKVFAPLTMSSHSNLIVNILNALVVVEKNPYWLCKVNLCKLYEKLPYPRLYMLYPTCVGKGVLIMNTLYRLLADQDQKVRSAAANAITLLVPKIYPNRTESPAASVTQQAKDQSEGYMFNHKKLSLDLVRETYFYYDLPEQLKAGDVTRDMGKLKVIVAELLCKLMESSCKFYSQGLLETLHSICRSFKPWSHISAYRDLPIMEHCLDTIDYCNSIVQVKTLLLGICTMMYPVEIHKVMSAKTGADIFERDTQPRDRWQHLRDEKCQSLAEKFLQVTLKMLNILVHLIEEVNPNVHVNKSGIALPGSPVRRKTQEVSHRKNSSASDGSEEKTLRKKPPVMANSLRANFVGHFFNEPFYMKLYEDLRATYSNYKINLDPKSSIFHEFLTAVLDALSIQLELSTEREFGYVTEEILYYLKVTMPFRADTSVFCITQLLKCLFSTNMISQYQDFMSIKDSCVETKAKPSFYDDVITIGAPIRDMNDDASSRRSSVSSNVSQKLSMDAKNPTMVDERNFLIKLENFHRNKMDRKWSANKKELERYIRLFEPVVIQALKSYTMQNDIPLQCKVLCLLNQLLTLRVNYCMLDSDQIFIGFLLKQLDLVEQHEIPNSCDLVHNILLFLVQLSSSKHHSKQIIEIPKLIQLCDGLMASGAHAECVRALQPVVVRVFCSLNSAPGLLGRTQQQEAQATREVLFYMMQKTMHDAKVLELVSCVLALSQEHPESYYRWSELASDTLLNLLSQRSLEISSREDVCLLERLLDSIYKDVLLEQGRVETLLRILFKAPPDQATAPFKTRIQYLAIIMVLLRKIFVHIPESETLLAINDLKASHVSPQSIFFNVKTEIDPLNVQSVNENCASLPSDVILVRFLFKTLTHAILEVERGDGCHGDGGEELLNSVCVNLICQIKNMLHLTSGCILPLTAKTAQNILHNEQSGLNTGLYSPEENIPLDLLNLICLRAAHRLPLLTVHWSHLLIRFKFLEHKYWRALLGYVRNLPLGSDDGDMASLQVNTLQIGCVMAYCEYFVENGLSEAVHLSWLLVNRVHILVGFHHEPLVGRLLALVQMEPSASGLLLQAVAARCQPYLKDEFALNTWRILSDCDVSQSGALIFLTCRIIGKLEPSIAVRFAKLAIDRCKKVEMLPVEDLNVQLSKEDVQVAFELLQRDKVHIRYSSLVAELNSLASSLFDLSPLDLSQERAINPQYIANTNVDNGWLVSQVKSRCCQTSNSFSRIEKRTELAMLLQNLSKDDMLTVMSCAEFDRKILTSCFKVACDVYLKDFLNVYSVYESKEIEKDNLLEQREAMKLKEETASANVDSNIVANTLHVFKKSDSKESKSQFFIPIKENKEAIDLSNLKLSDFEPNEIVPPELPNLFLNSLASFEKCLADIIRLFPKQSRPLSQSENFNLDNERTIDRYTIRCHQVFQDKLFYQEFCVIQTVVTGYLESLHRLSAFLDDLDCDVSEKVLDNVLPGSLARNIAIFTVISLQYVSFLIKNKRLVESPIHTDVSFRASSAVADKIVIDNAVGVAISNASRALTFKDIWAELNVESNVNRIQSAISCLYAITKYFLKDTKPLILKDFIKDDASSKSDIVLTCNKLLSLIEYWEVNFYGHGLVQEQFLGQCYKKPLESLLISLARLDVVCHIALIPPIEWPSVGTRKDLLKTELPLQAFQDMDTLEPFLFRVNFIGWSSKKLFEEIWVGLLGALQGNGTHWAVKGISQLLITTVPKVRRDGISEPIMMHLPRKYDGCSSGIQKMRNIVVGTAAFGKMFNDVNIERIPLQAEDWHDGYHYAQFNTEYLKLAADITDEGSYRARLCLKRMKHNVEVDLTSCLQLLMDVATQMLHPKSPTGLSARCALLSCVIAASDLYDSAGQWCWLAQQLIALTGPEHRALTQYQAANQRLLYGLAKCVAVLNGFDGLAELSSVHEKLVKSLASPHAALRQAALQGCLLQPRAPRLGDAVQHYLQGGQRISVYEQSLYWAVLFSLVQGGQSELMHTAVDFILQKPTHYCADLVVKGITSMIRMQVLPKDLKNAIIEKLLDSTGSYSEAHAVQILTVHLFTAHNKLLSPKVRTDVSNMDPDVLMSTMERITLLYKKLKMAASRETKYIAATTLKYFLRETLPPAATLSRVVIEFVESCRDTEKCGRGILDDRDKSIDSSVLNAEIVFEVFQTAISQDQLPVVSGWIFEALCHLLTGKISSHLLPYLLLCLLVSASSQTHVRSLAPLTTYALRYGFHVSERTSSAAMFDRFVRLSVSEMGFSDRRLLCTVALHSKFTDSQLVKLRELCAENDCFEDLFKCLSVLS